MLPTVNEKKRKEKRRKSIMKAAGDAYSNQLSQAAIKKLKAASKRQRVQKQRKMYRPTFDEVNSGSDT